MQIEPLFYLWLGIAQFIDCVWLGGGGGGGLDKTNISDVYCWWFGLYFIVILDIYY